MQMRMDMAGGGRRGGGGGSGPFGEPSFSGSGPLGGFEFTFLGSGNPFAHMGTGARMGGGGPSMYGSSR